MTVDVIVIGGGIAGLYAAWKCQKKGLKVVVLEKADRLGGRIRTIYKPYQYEAGAARFHTQHVLLRSLLQIFHLHEIPITKKKHFEGTTSPEQKLLDKVMLHANSIDPVLLRSVSFRDLCAVILGEETLSLLVNSFGYNAEFEHVNAYDGLQMFQREFNKQKGASYFICAEGLSELVVRLAKEIGHDHIHQGVRVVQIKKLEDDMFRVEAKNALGADVTYDTTSVICALPKQDMETLKIFNKTQRSLLDTVVPVPLHRIYGKFPMESNGKPWFHKIPRTTTRNPIRQFIPINNKAGLAMVSYSDSRYATDWKHHADQGTEHLQREVLQQLQVVFPNISHIPTPNWIQSYFWPQGIHLWKTGVSSDVLVPKIQQILGPEIPFYIVGEAYARHQGWIEGTLESVEAIMPLVQYHHRSKTFAKHSPAKQQGGHTTTNAFDAWLKRRNFVVKHTELPHIRERFPKEKWVLITLPDDGLTRLLDIEEWMHRHPGGDVFSSRLYTDISKYFLEMPYHYNADNRLHDHVYKALNMYTKAVIR